MASTMIAIQTSMAQTPASIPALEPPISSIPIATCMETQTSPFRHVLFLLAIEPILLIATTPNFAIKPSASEVCDTIDNDCDNDIDEADSSLTDGNTYYADSDQDTFETTIPLRFPVLPHLPMERLRTTRIVMTPMKTHSLEQRPNDSATECMTDADGDDYGSTVAPTGGTAGSDCDDADGTINATHILHRQ